MSKADTRIDLVAFIERRWLLLTIVLLVLIASNLWVQYSFQWVRSFLAFELGFAALTLLLPWTIKTLRYSSVTQLAMPVCSLSSLPSEQAKSWFLNRLRPYTSNAGVLTASAVLLAAGLISTEVFGIPWTGEVRIYFYLWLLIFFIGYGMVGWLYFGLMALANHIGELEVKSSVFSWPKVEIKRVYSIYFRLFIVGAILYIVAVISVWISPGGAWIAKNTGIGRLWVFPPGAMVIVFFLYFHYKTHLLLVQCKDRSERRLASLLTENFDKWTSSPSEEIEKTISSLMQWRKGLQDEGTWLLDFKSVLATIATLLLPTVKAVIDLLR